LGIQDSRHLATFAGQNVECTCRRARVHHFESDTAACHGKDEFAWRKYVDVACAQDDDLGMCVQQQGEIALGEFANVLCRLIVNECHRRHSNRMTEDLVTDPNLIIGHAVNRQRARYFACEFHPVFPLPWKSGIAIIQSLHR